VGETENPGAGSADTGLLDEVLHLGRGFSDDDRPWVLEALSRLEPHLSRWDPASMTVDVSVKDRDSAQPQVTLRADLPGYPQLVAKATRASVDQALAEAKRELIQQIEAEKRKREPKSNRQLRKKAT
jgi:ribosome-associated translation inhibitor RaiA